MKKIGAIGILTTIFLGFCAWSATTIIDNSINIGRLKERDISTKELLHEVKADVKILLQRVK